jgi:hypothetical protein
MRRLRDRISLYRRVGERWTGRMTGGGGGVEAGSAPAEAYLPIGM